MRFLLMGLFFYSNHRDRHIRPSWMKLFNPLQGAASENVQAGLQAKRPKTSLLPYMEISIQSHENLINNNSTRLPLLPPHHFALSLFTKLKWERFWKASRRNMLLVFKMDLFNDSDYNKWFFGFHTEDIVLWEAVVDSDFDVNEVCDQ